MTQIQTSLANCCTSMMLVETCVSFRDDESVDFVEEPASSPSHAVSGLGCRPRRLWVHRRLSELFPHVYLPTTQPCHPEFPIDWTVPPGPGELTRAIFVASRTRLRNRLLTKRIRQRQARPSERHRRPRRRRFSSASLRESRRSDGYPPNRRTRTRATRRTRS
jgi:hypothetical protein